RALARDDPTGRAGRQRDLGRRHLRERLRQGSRCVEDLEAALLSGGAHRLRPWLHALGTEDGRSERVVSAGSSADGSLSHVPGGLHPAVQLRSSGDRPIPEGHPATGRRRRGEAMSMQPSSVRAELVEARSRPSMGSGRTAFVAALALAFTAAPASAQTAEERLDQLDARITRLEDLNAIERLQKAYGYFVDKGQWTHLSELFTDDATLEIGGKGLFLGKHRVLEYMHTAFGPDGAREGNLANHMQFQSIPDISVDGSTGWVRSRAYVMSSGGWGLPLYENEYKKEDGVWKISRLTGPFPMYTNWHGWGKNALNNTWPDKFDPAPDLPPSVVYLTYPAYYIIPFHYPNPVTGEAFTPDPGEAGAYHRPPGTAEQQEALKVGRTAKGTQPIAEPPRN